ncbi:putative aldose 1-epimerase [Mycobacterium ulcerans str. Harvey]|uniref:Aldose 1-epimerase n=1 Tax=Mycobacterium ulcerans str. Harvey TaxID=1299332 RepID=A0ABN0R854_MYCUL|nr:putative aldose 1-epimerase [Mycobacterium ulcerans str. Harvey]
MLLASFPYPHVLSLTARLAERVLTLRTTVTPTGDTAVPLCFGFHPYLQLPGVPAPSGSSRHPAAAAPPRPARTAHRRVGPPAGEDSAPGRGHL